jgi:integrase
MTGGPGATGGDYRGNGMNVVDILTKKEIGKVLADLKRRMKRSVNQRQNLTVFRLSCCCGLRCMEICGLDLADLHLAGDRPYIFVGADITKGQEGQRRARKAPLWWDAGTLEDLRAWKTFRIERQRGTPADPVVCAQDRNRVGQRITEDSVAKRWRTAIRAMGEGRVRDLHIHCGRHSFCSHALAAGRSLVEVRDAAGHRNISTTSIYLHVLDNDGVPDVFALDVA